MGSCFIYYDLTAYASPKVLKAGSTPHNGLPDHVPTSNFCCISIFTVFYVSLYGPRLKLSHLLTHLFTTYLPLQVKRLHQSSYLSCSLLCCLT